MSGEGGSYIIDEKGNKVLVERTQDARQNTEEQKNEKPTEKVKGSKNA